jgi:transketolase C-terminal domain/subunit
LARQRQPDFGVGCGANIWTRASISVGENGPIHQPIEQLISLRAIPGMVVMRPKAHGLGGNASRACRRRAWYAHFRHVRANQGSCVSDSGEGR